VPAKLYEYLATGRPVLALAEQESDTAWVLRESGAVHRLAPPNDAVQITTALLELAQEARTAPAPALHTQRFTREHLVGQLADILRDLIETQTGGLTSTRSPRLLAGGGLQGSP
jgi:hypothetical protein